ncbi:MAG: adenylosuccinate synthetase, partial [Aeoliella sp.]
MPGTCVIGLQWGDEAKGKIVDLLTAGRRFVVRYQGGANAGHTVVVGDEVYKLSLLPSGVLTPGVTCVIAGGVVLNPAKVLEEIDELLTRGIPLDGDALKISDRTHIILPWHFAEDRVLDSSTGGESIGTTQRGIGPCYRDKVARSYAVRLGDMYRPEFKERVEHITDAKNRVLAAMVTDGEFEQLDADAIYQQYAEFARRLEPYVADTTDMLLTSLEKGEQVIFEGAQGSLLDVDHGTYPYVTSSNTVAGQAATGSGLGPRAVGYVLGIV